MQALGIYLQTAGVAQVHQYFFNYLPTPLENRLKRRVTYGKLLIANVVVN